MHHPPFQTLIGHMDKIGLLSGGPELEAIVARHPNVERVICGHLHRAIDVRFGGTIASYRARPRAPGLPGSGPRRRIGLDAGAAGVPRACLEAEAAARHPSGCQRRFEGPYPFHEGGALID